MQEPTLSTVSLSALDWLAVGIFLALVMGFAIWVKFRQQDSEDYFLAGRSMPWIVVAISTYATLFSTIAFVATPGEAYQNGLLLSLGLLSAFMYPLAVWIFLKFFFMTKSFTAYQYLEERFNLPTRLAGGLIYCVIRLMYAGTVLYAAAHVLQAMIGWQPMMTILAIGAFTLFYTANGGMKAVMFTDVVQGAVILVGIILIGFVVLQAADFSVCSILTYATAHDHGFGAVTEPEFWRLDLHDRYSFWLLLIYLVTAPIQAVTADQSTIQRLLSANNYREAKRAVITQAFANIPIGALLWLIGIGLFYYYGTRPQLLPQGIAADQIFGYFIYSEMPTPLPGLIVASLLAALMSTLDSTVNCIANVIHRDGLIRLGVVEEHGRHELRLCRVISVVAGVLGIGFAVFLTLAGSGIKSSVMEISAIWSSLWGVLMMPFVLGVLVPFVSGRAMFVGLVVGGLTNFLLPYVLYYNVPVDDRISFLWVGVPGMLLAGAVPLLLSLLWPNRKSLTDLTHWTISETQEDSVEMAVEGGIGENAG